MKPLTIAIMGTRGVPNRYGGFEQVASILSDELVQRGHVVTVYNSHNHPYQEKRWKGVTIIHCYDPEHILGTAGQFLYDLNCIRHARKQRYDVILMLGYTSSSVWGGLFPTGTAIVFNMDGLEWKRAKYSKPVKRFLQYAEKLAVTYADRLVADSPVIQAYLAGKYQVPATHIPYGATCMAEEDDTVFKRYGLEKKNYDMLMARMEPENNIEMILEGFCNSTTDRRLLVVGNTATAFGSKMVKKFRDRRSVVFAGAAFEQLAVYALRKHCRLYFHGHSVGGTNPSLLEAMASGAMICAHDNPFNRAVLGEDACYFSTAREVAALCTKGRVYSDMVANNSNKIALTYNWQKVTDAYEQLFIECYQSKK